MIKDLEYMTKNARLVCAADFFWNVGRTLPHAILTVYLISLGCSLVEIALLQTVFMITAMLAEFPSGVISDIISRKAVYITSIVLLFFSYLLIGLAGSTFWILIIAYILYGLSVSFKTGTLEAEVVLEYRKDGKDIKQYSVFSSYVMSISSITGGLIGSFLYTRISSYIYLVSANLFLISLVFAFTCQFNVNKETVKKRPFIEELRLSVSLFKSYKGMMQLLFLYAAAALFLQPFFQYWQVLYEDDGIKTEFFGVVYVAFQICNIIGVWVYNTLKVNKLSMIIILIGIPAVFGIGTLIEGGTIIALPVSIVLFYAYYQHLDVIQKRITPEPIISSFFSLTGTTESIASSLSLFLMALCIERFNIRLAYTFLFVLFSIVSIVIYRILIRQIHGAELMTNK